MAEDIYAYGAVAKGSSSEQNSADSFEMNRVDVRAPKQERDRGTQEGVELIEVAEVGGGATDIARALPRKWSLLQKVSWEWDEFDDINRKVTVKALMNDEENPLLLAIKVIEKLHERAGKKEPNANDFIHLANRLEEFTLRFLDPLKHQKRWREDFAFNPKTEIILETAIKLEQKTFFDHPIIEDIVNERWHGDRRVAFRASTLWWLFLNIWCLFDMVLFPLSFFLAFAAGWLAARSRCMRSFFERRLFYLGDDEVKSTSIYKRYKVIFTLPYFIFVRDTISYLALLGLYLAICLEPSQIAFSNLEWAILVFQSGRLLMEISQILHLIRSEDVSRKARVFKSYFRDRWNLFDCGVLSVYFCAILPLRIYTWVESESVANNSRLEIAGYLYGSNTFALTVRVFGSILETIEGFGTIQIALFQSILDASVIVLHFVVVTLAFSSTLTKVFVVERSIAKEENETNFLCNQTGILCWWKISDHLGKSILDLSDGLDFFGPPDSLSKHLAYVLFGFYLVMGLIFLINMLIALLSNTYQRVQDNSRKEWAFHKAVAIQTYSNYHPIPVPFNIISTLVMSICGFCTKQRDDDIDAVAKREQHERLDHLVINLQHKYTLKYGDSFPPTYKLDKVVDDAENTSSMVNQVLYKTFTKQQGYDKALLPTGAKAWETSRHIAVEGFLLLSTNYGSARYRTAFSRRFPHFEVMVLENGVTKWFALGIVFDDYMHSLPGKTQGTVGFHTGERTIWTTDEDGTLTKMQTRGPAATRRGDVIRCTVMFEDQQEKEGKVHVPVVFTVNGSRIMTEKGQTFIEYNPHKLLYPQIGFYYENSVLTKMSSNEDIDYQQLHLQELKSDLSEVKSELADVCKHLINTKEDVVRHEIKSDLANAHEDFQMQDVKCELESEFTKLKSDLACVKSDLKDIRQQVVVLKNGLRHQDLTCDVGNDRGDSNFHELANLKSDLSEVKRSLEEKLDAVLDKLKQRT